MSGISGNKSAMLIIRPVLASLVLAGIGLQTLGFFALMHILSDYSVVLDIHRMNMLPMIMIGALSFGVTLCITVSGWTRIFPNRRRS